MARIHNALFAMETTAVDLAGAENAEATMQWLDSQEDRDQLHEDDIDKYGENLNLSPGGIVRWRVRQVKTPVPEQPFRFADLPPELRNRIAELALYHSENEGIISPACFNSHANGIATAAYVAGRWRTGRLVRSNFGGDLDSQAQDVDHGFKELVRFEEDSKSGPSDYDLTEAEQCSGLLQPYDFFYEGSLKSGANFNFIHGHVCSYLCLLQPALTLVSRQLRADSLSLFYALNEFGLMVVPQIKLNKSELNNNSRLARSLRVGDKRPMAVNFWRAIGDTNLRSIKLFALSLGTDCDLQISSSLSGPVELDIARAPLDDKQHQRATQLQEPNPADQYYKRKLKLLKKKIDEIEKNRAERKAENLAFTQLMAEGGVCVQNIERAFSSFVFEADWVAKLKSMPRVTLEEQAAVEARCAMMFPYW
ncbi:hypothetical protein LTR56_009359 [Elasticomyces elasticus]|nr:hypothetical protein LTR56_009359 [Elasticomyces elasticus]KAK3666327.1 hypothetical protein LTR22_002631 [Elasticomyces elasticus]